MSKPLQRIITFVVSCSLLFISFRPATACGPFFLDSIFVYSVHPDWPFDGFVKGRLGVLQPTYARSYLYAAYRQMMGLEFDATEQSALLELWKERLGYISGPYDEESLKRWTDARAGVPGIGPAPKIDIYRSREKPNEYETYLNCQGDAFVTAANTLTERQKQHGADTAELKDWVQAQDTVFSNCSEGQSIPTDATAGAPAWLRMDRQYQVAAANFYAGRFPEAKERYEAIARDSSSPWKQIAEYMIARTSLRQASLGKDEDKPKTLGAAETKLKEILAEKRLSSQHHASARLLNLVRLRLHPEEKLRELSAAILKKGAGQTLKQDVWDFTLLLDKFLGEGDEETGPPKEIPASVRADDVSDWIATFESDNAAATEHALQKLKQTNSLPWLVAALSKADSKDSQVASLLAEAARVDRRSPVFPSLAFHRVRLMMEGGQDDAARQLLDEILDGERSRMTASAVNLFLGQRMILARNLAEFLSAAPRVPAGLSYEEDDRELPSDDEDRTAKKIPRPLFDQDAVHVFNQQMPLGVLVSAATSTSLPAHLRRDVAQAAWLRAALLDRREEASQASQILGVFYPQLKSLLTSYQNETTPDARRFAASYIALRFPGLRPTVTAGVGRSSPIEEVDSYRDNWWCLAGTSAVPQSDPDKEQSEPPARLPVFLSETQSSVAAKEVRTLNALGSAPNFLARTAIAAANRKPSDPRVPEALHLAVTATRRGCTDKETGRWSKAAFDLLHQRYPTNPWTKKTKYWFKD